MLIPSRGHLAGAIARIDDDVLTNADKRRFINAVGDDYWIARNHGGILARIRAELEDAAVDAESPSTEQTSV